MALPVLCNGGKDEMRKRCCEAARTASACGPFRTSPYQPGSSPKRLQRQRRADTPKCTVTPQRHTRVILALSTSEWINKPIY
eukprot:6192824-Pleurochrysis_carterae.AAC.4